MPHPIVVRVALCAALACHAASSPAQTPVPGAPGSLSSGAPGQPPAPRTGQSPARDQRPGQAPVGTAVIRGQVVAADTGVPLRRAMVRAFSQTPGGGSGMAQTDAEGRYEIKDLPAGRYGVSVNRTGYVSMQFGQRAPNQPGTPVELSDGQVADKVHFVLVRGGAITGRITDELGEPMAGVEVHAQRYANIGGRRQLVGGGGDGGGDRTDDLGQYRLFGLSPGDYFISATLRAMDFMPMNAASAAPSMDGYAPTYFPGTPDLAQARSVTVRPAQDMANINFALMPARMGRITGRVLTSAGQPHIGGMVILTRRGGNEPLGITSRGWPVRPDGSFQTGGLTPGEYRLTVQPPGIQSDRTAEVARLDITLDSDGISDLTVVTGRGGIIRGRVVTDDGSVPPFAPQQVRLFPQPTSLNRPMMGRGPITVNDDWTFEVTGLTDSVFLRGSVQSPGERWTIRHALLNGVDLVDEAAEVAPGSIVEGVEMVLTRKVTELSGLLTDDRSLPVTDASVVIFPADKARWGFSSRYVRVTRPDANGKYVLSLTPLDDYRVVAVRGLEDGQFSDPEFLARALAHATRVEVGEGERKTLNLRVSGVP